MLNIKRIFETIADAGQKILEKKSFKSITKKRDLLDLCDDLSYFITSYNYIRF